MFNLLDATYLIDTLEPIVIWTTVGLVAAALIAYFVMFFINKDLANKYGKIASIVAVFYALVIGIGMMILEIVKHFNKAYLEDKWVNADVITYVFVPILITLCLALISAAVLFILKKKNFAQTKIVGIIAGILTLLALIATIVTIMMYYNNHINGDGYYTQEAAKFNNIALYVCAGLLIVLSLVVAFVLGRHDKQPLDTRCLAFAGVCVALSFALSYIKLFSMPQGGSITLVSMLPVMLFAYVYGTKKGLLIGFIYGMLQAVQTPYIIHPAQFLLDYPVAFAMVGFAGLLTDLNVLNNIPQLKFGISAAIAGFMRFISHVFSGVFAFGAYAIGSEATNFWTYSLVYNSYVLVDVLIVVVIGVLILSSKNFVRELNKMHPIQSLNENK